MFKLCIKHTCYYLSDLSVLNISGVAKALGGVLYYLHDVEWVSHMLTVMKWVIQTGC